MAGISSEESIDMSAYPTVFSPDTLHRKGLCPVTTLAHKKAQEESSVAAAVLPEEHSLYYEVGDLLIYDFEVTSHLCLADSRRWPPESCPYHGVNPPFPLRRYLGANFSAYYSG